MLTEILTLCCKHVQSTPYTMLPSGRIILYGRDSMWRIWTENFLCRTENFLCKPHAERENFDMGRCNKLVRAAAKMQVSPLYQ